MCSLSTRLFRCGILQGNLLILALLHIASMLLDLETTNASTALHNVRERLYASDTFGVTACKSIVLIRWEAQLSQVIEQQ